MQIKMQEKASPRKITSDPQTLQTVKNIISTFSLALKNISLYPEGHEASVSSVSNLENRLTGFLEKHQCLQIYVKNDHFLFEEEVVFKGEADETNPAFIFYKDGIQRIAFNQGIEQEELSGILRVINQHAASQEEPEGDLVTALWDMNLSNFEYLATDMLWEAEPLYDLFLERQGEMEGFRLKGKDEADPVVSGGDSNIKNPLLNVSLNIIDVNDWRLSEDEKNLLQMRVAEEIKKESAEDVFDVLLYILRKQDKENDFSNILEFMKEELGKALIESEFIEVLLFLKNLGKIRGDLENAYPWSQSLIEKFYQDISDYKFIKVLECLWPAIPPQDATLHNVLRQILMFLRPKCILSLLPMLSKISSEPLRVMIIDVITQQARLDNLPLQQLLSNPQTSVARNIAFVLNRIEGDSAVKMLLRILRHPSERARKDALKALIKKGFDNINQLFFLLDDPDDEVKQLLLKFMGRQRNQDIEQLLLNRLTSPDSKNDCNPYILDCYRVLGKCGSDYSIEYLSDILFKEKFNISARRFLHRQGACIALQGLSLKTADDLLKKASKSLIPTVRKAYKCVEGNQ
ncbi:MAG: HEAT repeat domain-containing protein [Desulfobacterales bacterium]|nr:HEAT repeat domain-containing protein [Desulfobacterales bacterium]